MAAIFSLIVGQTYVGSVVRINTPLFASQVGTAQSLAAIAKLTNSGSVIADGDQSVPGSGYSGPDNVSNPLGLSFPSQPTAFAPGTRVSFVVKMGTYAPYADELAAI
jgi:hypothetical protein